jgi:hypothetical protein
MNWNTCTWHFLPDREDQCLWWGQQRNSWSKRNKPHQGSHTCLFPISLLTELASAANLAFWFWDTPIPPSMRATCTFEYMSPRKGLSQEHPAKGSTWQKRNLVSNNNQIYLERAYIITLCCVNNIGHISYYVVYTQQIS